MTEARVGKFLWLLMLLVMMTWAIGLSSASAWWNEEWQYRKKISLNTGGTGMDVSQNLMDFPVLIRLHSGNFDFTRARENGEDIRFVGADDTTLLKYHIEAFDIVDELALIWVKVPNLAGNSGQGAVFMYYGNQAAAAGDDPKGCFDPAYQGVYHFNEFEGIPKDSSSYGMNSSEYTAGLGLAGVIGNGGTFSGAGNYMRLPDNPAFDFSKGVTFSTWFKMFQAQDNAWLFSRISWEDGLVIAIKGTRIQVRIVAEGKQTVYEDESFDLPIEGWHHLAVTIDPKGQIKFFLDGAETSTVESGAGLAGLKGDILVGSNADGNYSFAGDLDEVRISGAPRLLGWIKGCSASQGPGANLCGYAVEEILEGSGGMPVFYLATIFKSITLDGLVVIGILIFMGACSAVVILSKALFLLSTSKSNKKFMEAFNTAQDPVALGNGSGSFNGSSIYRIYEAGLKSLNIKKTVNPESAEIESRIPGLHLTSKAVESLKAVLEKGLIDESKRLNSWMVILTMSISGGPFLGLLGTVWGVMNTFAAMAEAGEANIMAIAPGVASALSTTVFGLIVAIPALFGYSFLVGRIRDTTADLTVFVDQFPLKVDAVYGDES